MIQVDSRLVMGATLFGTPEVKGGIHVSGLVCLLIVLVVTSVGLILYRHGGSRPGPSDPNSGGGWGKGPPGPEPRDPHHPRGGIPLDDAAPARVRLRGEGRLADARPARARRHTHKPDRAPRRTGPRGLPTGR
jgi:hypothetical protein